MTQLIGQVFHDRYQIDSLLGRKTGRRTFLTTDLETRLPVVLKLLLFGPDFTWEDLKLFEREAGTLESLNHSAIPTYLDSFEVDTELGKGFALVQSYIEARSLQDWIQSGRTFSEEDLKAIAKELLEILHYLHSRQPTVIHRDIKPSNVLLGDRSGNSPGQVYLVDFGSVQTIRQDGTITIVGTYGYMPPEQFSGQVTAAADLYALGATLIYIATGQHPYELPHQEMRILFAEKVNLDQHLIDWLQWLTEPYLELRLNSAKQALDALENKNLQERLLAIANKPSCSNINVKNTRQILEILIPPKLDVGHLIGMTVGVLITVFITASLCVNAVQAWGQYMVGAAVVTTVFGCLFSVPGLLMGLEILNSLLTQRLRITPQHISLMPYLFNVKFFIGLTAPKTAIEKIELIHLRYRQDPDGTTTAIPPRINLWAGMVKFELGSKRNTALSRLTDREVDWLAQILSDWLELPVEEAKPRNQILSVEKNAKSNAADNSQERIIWSNLTALEKQPKINCPSNSICTIKRSEKSIEIVTPPAPFKAWKVFYNTLLLGLLLETFVFLPIWFLIVNLIAPWVNSITAAFPILMTPVVIVVLSSWIAPMFWFVYWSFRSKKRRHTSSKISLQIDQHDVYLWEQLQPKEHKHRERRLNKAPRSTIQKLKLVYKKGKKASYHIGISTKSTTNVSENMILVGNRSFWLSQPEAEWLAYELSIWLKLPITEVEVVESNSV